MLQNAPFQLYFEKKVYMIKSINVITQHKLGLVERYSFFYFNYIPKHDTIRQYSNGKIFYSWNNLYI